MSAAIVTPDDATAARAGRAIGSMFFSVFGCAWIGLWSFDTFPGNWLPTAAIVLLGLALLAQSIHVYRSNKPMVEDLSAEKKSRDRMFHIINCGQWVAMIIAGNVLNNIGLSDWVLTAIMIIVGLHFLPMARLFRYTPHTVMGVALVLWAIAYAVLLGPANAIGCLGTGLILWVGALVAISGKPGARSIVRTD